MQRVAMIGGEFFGKTAESYVVRRDSRVIVSRAAYVAWIKFRPRFGSPSAIEQYKTAKKLYGKAESDWTQDGSENVVRLQNEEDAQRLYNALCECI